MQEIPRYDRSLLMGSDIHVKQGNKFEQVELHWHDYYELIVYFDADVYSFINGTETNLTSNSIYLLTPFDFHKTTNRREDNSISFLNISFSDGALGSEVIGKIDCSRIIKELSADDIIIKTAKLIAEIGMTSKENTVFLTSVLVNLICQRGDLITGIFKSNSESFIRKVYTYIADNFMRVISLNEISEYLHLAPAYFSSQFSKITGYTFVRYLTMFRLNYSKELLIHSDKTVTAICYECGFSNLSHFLRTFKSYFGYTPSTFRKNHNQK